VRERFDADGTWTGEELTAMEPRTIAAIVGQDPGHPLMADFAAALRDVGGHLLAEFDGRYLGVVEAVATIPDLAARLAGWEAFADVSSYERREVPFFKRAQLAAAEVELRGAAVHAVELLSAATRGTLSPAEIDSALWNRGAAARYKSRPRPRSRNTAY
jgi:Potential Queuosine, Q, salvage protein family